MLEPEVPEPATEPDSSVPGRLLATLLSQNMLVQPEVVLTRATQFLLNLPGAASALDDLVTNSGLEPELGGFWRTEVRGEDGARTDLEYWWGEPGRPQVIVEAKIGHILSTEQLDYYRSRIGDEGLLVALVPVTRRQEAEDVVTRLRIQYAQSGDSVQVAMWTWDDVVSALERAKPGQADVIQLRGLVATAGALDLPAFSEAELLTSDTFRFDDLWSVLDRASFTTSSFPSQRDRYFQRYRFYPVDAFDAYFSVGIGRTNRVEAEPWIWVRIGNEHHLAHLQHKIVKQHRPDAHQDSDGSVAFPLHLEPSLSGYELTKSLRAQLKGLASLIGEGLRSLIPDVDLADMQVDDIVLAPLHEIAPFTAADLLDSDPSRLEDIETVVQQACRHVFRGAYPRWLQADAAFAKRNWITIDHFRSHMSIGIARMDPASEPRPWAWLSVKDDVPHVEVMFQALDETFPGRVVDIPGGRALPLAISTGESGVNAFVSVVTQIEQAKTALRKALRSHAAHPSD